MIDLNKVIDKDSILSKVSQEKIFEKYLNIKPLFGISYKNPFREDSKGDCKFYHDSRGMLKFNDIARKQNWDCFNIVQERYKFEFNKHLSFAEVIKIIASDFDITNKYPDAKLLNNIKLHSVESVNKNTNLKVTYRKWNNGDLNYWKKYEITLNTLMLFNVKPVSQVYLNDNMIYRNNNNDPCYCYHFRINDIKLYFPKRLKDSKYSKFIHLKSNLIQGFDQLPLTDDILIITKSLKDIMSLSLFNYSAIAPMSETSVLNIAQMNYLKTRFKYIYSLFDNDITGITLANKMEELYNIPKLMFPKTLRKDLSDNIERYGIEFMKKIDNKFKNYHNGIRKN